MKDLLKRADVRAASLARWTGVTDRSIRHYLAGTRKTPVWLTTLLEFLIENPGAKAWFVQREEQKKASRKARPSIIPPPGFPLV